MQVGETAYERTKRIPAEEPQPSAQPSLVDELLADIGNAPVGQGAMPARSADVFTDNLNTR